MVSIGAMSAAQVDEVLAAQKSDPAQRQFGAIAIEKGYTDAAAVARYEKENPR